MPRSHLGPDIGLSKEEEVIHFWRLRNMLRDARTRGDLAAQADITQDLRDMSQATNDRDIALRCVEMAGMPAAASA